MDWTITAEGGSQQPGEIDWGQSQIQTSSDSSTSVVTNWKLNLPMQKISVLFKKSMLLNWEIFPPLVHKRVIAYLQAFWSNFHPFSFSNSLSMLLFKHGITQSSSPSGSSWIHIYTYINTNTHTQIERDTSFVRAVFFHSLSESTYLTKNTM